MLSIKYVRLLKIKKNYYYYCYYYYYYYYYYPRLQVLKTVIYNSRQCEAIATMTRTLCTQYIDPTTIQPLVANHPIPLDKSEGAVRPIGVGEVLRRICGKCVMSVPKKDVVGTSGSLQLCAGQKSRRGAAIHMMHTIFESDDTDAAPLIDASNAFNKLNRVYTIIATDSQLSYLSLAGKRPCQQKEQHRAICLLWVYMP